VLLSSTFLSTLPLPLFPENLGSTYRLDHSFLTRLSSLNSLMQATHITHTSHLCTPQDKYPQILLASSTCYLFGFVLFMADIRFGACILVGHKLCYISLWCDENQKLQFKVAFIRQFPAKIPLLQTISGISPISRSSCLWHWRRLWCIISGTTHMIMRSGSPKPFSS